MYPEDNTPPGDALGPTPELPRASHPTLQVLAVLASVALPPGWELDTLLRGGLPRTQLPARVRTLQPIGATAAATLVTVDGSIGPFLAALDNTGLTNWAGYHLELI